MTKKFYMSKTFWINLLLIFVMVIQSYTGFVITPEEQAMIIGVINIILRFMTGEPLET